MKIQWFSPLPPDLTDIGHFSVRVLRELSRIADVTVWTQTRGARIAGLDRVELRTFDPERPDYGALNRGGATIYNIGNHGPFHADIVNISREVPGIIILHEADLQGLFIHLWLDKQPDHEAYIRHARQQHGVLGEMVARARLAGLPAGRFSYRFPIVVPAIERSQAVICHTVQVEQIARRLARPALRLDLPFATTDLARPQTREGLIRLVQFGYLGPHRKLDSILDALAAHPARDRFRFDVYGRLWDEAHVHSRIDALGLREHVTFHGFVEEAALDRSIAEADMVFNLRYPTIGEASGTQMRIWNAAAPSLVTDHGWFATLADEAVIKVKPGNEARTISDVLSRLAADRYVYDAIGRCGRAILEEKHRPAHYARHLLEFAGGLGEVPDFGREKLLRLSHRRAVDQLLDSKPARKTLLKRIAR